MPGFMTFDPCRQYRNDISLFFGRQFSPGWDAVPLGQTSPAAAGRGVLGDKDRMPAHRGLPPVIGNNGRSEAHAHEICGMTPDSLHAFSLDIGDIFRFLRRNSDVASRANNASKDSAAWVFSIIFLRRLSQQQRYEQSMRFYLFLRGFSLGVFREQYQPCQSDGCRQRQNFRRQEQRFQ